MQETIIDSFLEVVAKLPQKEALFYKENHHFSSLTYEELYTYSQRLATYMKELGVGEGDRVLLVSENRPEWVIVDLASLILGAILVPVHSVLAPSQMAMIAEETEPKITFVSDQEMLGKILEVEVVAKSESFIGYFNYDLPADDPLIASGKVFYVKEKIYDETYLSTLEPIKHKPERVITIIYTSGTTGRFKGVELTNKNIISNITGVLSVIEVTEKDKFLSILPLSHVFERTVGYYIPMVLGATISYVLDPSKLAEVAEAEKPTIILAVPRLYEKVYQAVQDKAAKSFITKAIFKWAFKIGNERPKSSKAYKLADKLVFKKVKAAFGGNIRFFVSGAASLQPEIGKFFDALNIPVIEGYGLTETSPIISCNRLNKRKYGTIGLALPNVEVKTVKDELLVKGPSVFANYFKNPEKTKEALTKDGWFKTGDLVEIDKDGFIKFKAREKEIIALSTGKKLSPAGVEEKLELCPCVAQAFVFGDNQKHIGALIVPEKEKTNGLAGQELWNYLAKEIDDQANKHLSTYEQIKKFVIIKKDFSVKNGLLTPTLKLRRKEIETEFAKEIASVYEN
jgi:long-chain acyl-CoA synthetase